jgi:hypothetical protein
LLSHTIRRRSISALLAVSALGAGLLVPAATFAAEPTTAPTTTCPDTHWPASVQGRPTNLHAGARAGDYIWHDRNGWHLRVTHHGKRKVVFSGTIVSTTPMRVSGVRLEKRDAFKLSDDKLTLTYRFTNYGYIDGLNIKTACSQSLQISGSQGTSALPVSRIWLGKRHVHPLSNPFVVIKVS